MTPQRTARQVDLYFLGIHGPNTPLGVVRFFADELIASTEDARAFMRDRYRIYYGDTLTGRSWEEYDEGYIFWGGRDMDTPITVPTSRSRSGRAILMDSIVKIEKAACGTVIYRHPRFHKPSEEPPEVQETKQSDRAFRKISLSRGR